MLKSARNISSQSLKILYMMVLHTMILQTCQFHQVCNNLLKLGLVASGCVDLWITDFDNQLATDSSSTDSSSQVMQRHPDSGLLTTNLLQFARY